MISRTQAIVRAARKKGQTVLTEHEAKRVLGAYGVPVVREALVRTRAEARAAAGRIGWPVVLKACSTREAHKTEKGLIAVGLASDRELRDAFATLERRAGPDYDGAWLVQEMVKGTREIMIGMVRDPQFGPSVCFGLGGIFTEILQDVVFRVAPLRKSDAQEMMRGIRAHRILSTVRGLKAVDADLLCHCLMAVGRIGLDHPEITAIDVNPLIVREATPVAVDALMVLADEART